MSGQTFAGPDDPYYLSTRGVDSISFNKQDNPPLAYFNKGILYELVDGKLYYNGHEIAYAGAVSTTADALATTGADVNVSLASPPTAGQFLQAVDPTHAQWSSNLLWDKTFVTGVDPTNRLAFKPEGTGETTITLHTAATFDHDVYLPNATTNLVGCADAVHAKDIAVFPGADGSAISTTGMKLSTAGNASLMIADEIPHVTGTNEFTLVVGSQILPDPLASTSSSVVLATRSCPAIGSLNSSVLIGNTIFYQGTVGAPITRQIIIGDTFGAAGTYDGTQTTGNIAIGSGVGYSVTSADDNVILGHGNGYQLTSGSSNLLIGNGTGFALSSGSNNIMIGPQCGGAQTTGSGCVYLGKMNGAVESNTMRLGPTTLTRSFVNGIRGVTTGVADALPVVVDSAGQLGTVSSSIRFKENVADLSVDSAKIIDSLRPVEFNYIGADKPTIGLIAEEVEDVYPEMCVYEPNIRLSESTDTSEEPGKRQLLTVDYARLPILLLAEVQQLRARLAAAGL